MVHTFRVLLNRTTPAPSLSSLYFSKYDASVIIEYLRKGQNPVGHNLDFPQSFSLQRHRSLAASVLFSFFSFSLSLWLRFLTCSLSLLSTYLPNAIVILVFVLAELTRHLAGVSLVLKTRQGGTACVQPRSNQWRRSYLDNHVPFVCSFGLSCITAEDSLSAGLLLLASTESPS